MLKSKNPVSGSLGSNSDDSGCVCEGSLKCDLLCADILLQVNRRGEG